MGNLNVKRGNITIDYGALKINNGATTWTHNVLSDGRYAFTSSAGNTVKINPSSSTIELTPVSTASSSIKVGVNRTGNGYAYIDLTGDTTYTDYGLRVLRGNSGANTWSEITHRGTGIFNIATAEAATIMFKTTNTTRGLWTAGGNFVIGNYTTDIQSAYKLQLDTSSRALIGGGLTLGANQANTDAALHIAGVGNTTNNRMIQIGGNGSYSLNIMQGTTGNWFAWGVDSSNRWCINNGTSFGTTGLLMNSSHEVGIGGVPVAGYKLYTYGSTWSKLDQNGSTSINVDNQTNGASAQAAFAAKALGGDVVCGCVGTGWLVGGGSNWEVLNGGAGYLNTSTQKLVLATNHASGSINLLTGGAANTNIRLRVSSTGKFAFGYGSTTDATELIQIKNGNIKLDGVSGTHGIIFPDGSTQTSAATPYTLPTASTTTLGGVKVDGTTISITGGVISATSAGHNIQDEGTPATIRPNLNFVGDLVAVTDDAANSATVVTVSSAGLVLDSEVGSANGVAGLDATGRVPVAQLRYFPRRIQTLTNVNGNVSLDWSTYDEIRLTLTGNTTLTFTGALDGQACVLKIRQDATGGWSVVLPATVRYNTDISAYNQTVTAGAIDRLGFIYDGEDAKYDFVNMTRNLV